MSPSCWLYQPKSKIFNNWYRFFFLSNYTKDEEGSGFTDRLYFTVILTHEICWDVVKVYKRRLKLNLNTVRIGGGKTVKTLRRYEREKLTVQSTTRYSAEGGVVGV